MNLTRLRKRQYVCTRRIHAEWTLTTRLCSTVSAKISGYFFGGERYWQTDRQRTNHNRILLDDWWRSYCARRLKNSKHAWAIVCGHSREALTKPGYHSLSQVANPAIQHICTGSCQFTRCTSALRPSGNPSHPPHTALPQSRLGHPDRPTQELPLNTFDIWVGALVASWGRRLQA